MNEQAAFSHRGYVLTIRSHEVPKGGWVGTVAIEQVVDGKTNTHTFTWDWTHPLAARDATMAEAKHQAITWIDSQLPSASQ